MPTVYGGLRSRTFRVLWMLEELEAGYDHVAAMPRTPEVLGLNPSGKIPIYVEDDGTVITDSTAILTYLADKHGRLTAPAGTLDRARQDAMTQMILDELDGVLWTTSKHSFVLPEDRRHKPVKQTNIWEFACTLARMADSFDGPFLMGDRMTVPDIIFTHCLGWSIVAKYDPIADPWRDYFSRMRARDAYRATQALG